METSHLQILLAAVTVGVLLISHAADAIVVLSADRTAVPQGGRFRLKCRSNKVDGSTRELYKIVDGNEVRVPKRRLETETTRKNVSVLTVFSMSAQDAAGTYKCKFVINGTESFSNEITLRVCSDPELNLDQPSVNSTHVVGREECGFDGELTWLVNGHRVPRNESTGHARSSLVQNDDDSLQINANTECLVTDVCNATAVFAYFSQKRLAYIQKTLLIPRCCLPANFSTVEEPKLEPTQIFSVKHETSDSLEAEHDITATREEANVLEIEVLKLKKEVLPLQISFLSRLIREQRAVGLTESLMD